MLLKNCRFVITPKGVLENVNVIVENGKIASVTDAIPKGSKKDKIIDCKDKIVSPSFANAHTHLAMSLFRGYGEELELMQWLETKMWPIENKMDEKDIYAGSLLSCIELIKSGVTAFNDMYFDMNGVARAAKETGLRASLSWAVVDEDKTSQKGSPLKNAETFIKKWKKDKMILPSVGPHAIYTCNDELLKKSKQLANKHNTLLHMHVSETRKEVYGCWQKNKKRVIEYLDSLGILDSNTIAAHCGWLTKNEINVLSSKRVSIAHCPTSNMKLATGGEFPFSELFGKGANVAIGTDGSASNNNLNMFEEMKFASLLHKHSRWSATVATANQVFEAATINGFKALRINSGTIEKGKNADLVLLDAKDISLQPLTKDRLINHLVYSNPITAVDTVICNGKILMENKKITIVDEEKVLATFNKSVNSLF